MDVEKILSQPNSFFRKTNKESNYGYIYDSQIETAKDAVRQISRSVTRRNHVILTARMQSGKTGVCNAIANVISQTPLERHLAIDRYMFITGMNDCGLKKQTETRVLQQCIGANIDNTYTGKKSKRNLSDNKFFIMKNSDLLAYDGDINNTIIFIDECHYGSNAKNVLTKFLEKHEIDWRDRNELIKRNIYIISVSATPFDEIVSDTVGCKQIIELKPSDDYKGVTELMDMGLIYDADPNDIEEDGQIFTLIEDAYDRMTEKGDYGIVIIRTRKFDIIKGNKDVTDNFNIFEMTSNGSNIEYERFNQITEELVRKNKYNKTINLISSDAVSDCVRLDGKPLLVLIKGAYRAGITLNSNVKDYIYMIYDYSAKADTTAQALLGRMCGYRSKDDVMVNTKIYVNKRFSDMYSHWENNMQDRTFVPCSSTKFNWLPDNANVPHATLGSRSVGNIEIPLSDSEVRRLYQMSHQVKSRVAYMEQELPNILKKHGIKDLKYDYVGEAVMNGRNNYKDTKRFDSFSPTSAIYQFRPYKIKRFMAETGRDRLTKEDVGKSAVYVVLDAVINNNALDIEGNKRLLIYHVGVGQREVVPNVGKLYKPHKDTYLENLV